MKKNFKNRRKSSNVKYAPGTGTRKEQVRRHMLEDPLGKDDIEPRTRFPTKPSNRSGRGKRGR